MSRRSRPAPRPDGRSDAFVFFGATGDLAFKQIFPALAGLVRDEGFDHADHRRRPLGDLDSLRERARQSLRSARVHGSRPPPRRLTDQLRYVKGSDDDPRHVPRAAPRSSGDARHPLHYLADPAGALRRGRRPASARRAAPTGPGSSSRSRSGATWPAHGAQRDASTTVFAEAGRSSGSTTTWARSRSRTCSTSASPTASWSRSGIATTWRASRSRWPRPSTSPIGAPSTTRPGRSATCVQNHLLQVVSLLAMEPPSGHTPEAVRNEKFKVLDSIRPLAPGRRRARPVPRATGDVAGVAPDSDRRDVRGAAAAGRHLALGRRARSTSGPASACR